MYIFPAIDLYDGKAVRLYQGDYQKMTVYSENPLDLAEQFKHSGASHIHIVDLEGAKSGTTPNFDIVRAIKERNGCFCEIGGGVRSVDVIDRYMEAGLDRVILGTAALTDEVFLREAVGEYGDRLAVGVDIRDGFVAIRGWTEKSAEGAFDFCGKMQALGVKTLICTDISRDGAMQGTNRKLYERLSRELELQIVASGGVSSLDDVRALSDMKLYGAIIGKAYYTGAIDLKEAAEAAI